jgi:hypothetical protein
LYVLTKAYLTRPLLGKSNMVKWFLKEPVSQPHLSISFTT